MSVDPGAKAPKSAAPIIIGTLCAIAIALALVWFGMGKRGARDETPQRRAEKTLGAGARCSGQYDGSRWCIMDDHAYLCIDGDDEHATLCAKGDAK